LQKVCIIHLDSPINLKGSLQKKNLGTKQEQEQENFDEKEFTVQSQQIVKDGIEIQNMDKIYLRYINIQD